MRLLSLVASIGILTLSVGSLAACSADTASEDPVEDPATEDELKAAVITEKDDNKTISVAQGKSFTIALKDTPSTGFEWSVKSVDRSLGAPKVSATAPNPNVPGSAGLKKFTWATKSPVNDLVGKHLIELESKRSFGVARGIIFRVTVDIKAAGPGIGFCGGFAGATCGANEYCNYPATASCGMADQTGNCAPKPQFCTAQIQKVCACNGKTYNNECEANRAGVSARAQGPCAN